MPFCPLEETKSPRLREFAAYLESKRVGDRALNRGDVDPVIDTPGLAGAILLIERIRADQPDAGRYRIQLVGTQLAAIAERDFTGRWLDDIGLPSDGEWPYAGLGVITAGTQLFAGHIDLPWQERSHVTIEWVATTFAPTPNANDVVIFAFDKRPSASDE